MRRSLPRVVLKSAFACKASLEAERFQVKFSNPEAQIAEESIDYTLFIYADCRALLFWLPRLFDYLKHSAPKDSYHFDVVLFNMSDVVFSGELRALADEVERNMIYEFLIWMGHDDPESVSFPPNRAMQYQMALKLWAP